MLAGIISGVQTLLARLTAAKSAFIDSAISGCSQKADGYNSTLATKINNNLDGAITSRAAAATALLNSKWTDAKAGYVDKAISQTGIKAVQSGIVTLSGSSYTTNVTITAVTLSKSFLLFSKWTVVNDLKATEVRGRLTTTTNIEFYRFLYSENSVGMAWQVIEFY
jgi:hypothetical protein